MLEGAVNICLPAFCPDTSEIATAAAALTAKNPSHQMVVPTVAPGDSLYFVTVKLHQASGSSNVSNSNGSSLWTNPTSMISNQSSVGADCNGTSGQQQQQQIPAAGTTTAAAAAAGESPLTLTPCMFPQFTTPSEHDSDEQQQQQPGPTSKTAANSSSNSSRVHAYGNLVVISSVAGPAGCRSGSQTDSLNNSIDMAISAESSGSSSKPGSSSNGRGRGSSSSVCAGLVCSKVAGLTLGGQIAAGSYGRVYRGDYFGTKVSNGVQKWLMVLIIFLSNAD